MQFYVGKNLLIDTAKISEWTSYSAVVKQKLIELLCRKTYNWNFFDILAPINLLLSNFKNIYTSSVLTDRLYFRNTFANVAATFRILTYLEDKLINNLPIRSLEHTIENHEYSTLYEGFMLRINEIVNHGEHIGNFQETLLKDLLTVKESEEYENSINDKIYKVNLKINRLELDLEEIEEQNRCFEQRKKSKRQELELIKRKKLTLVNNIELVDKRKKSLQEYPLKNLEPRAVDMKCNNHKHISLSNKGLEAMDHEPDINVKVLNYTLRDYFENSKFKEKSSEFIPLPLRQKMGTTGQLSYIENAHNDYILSLDFNRPLGLLSTAADFDNEIHLWDLKNNNKVTTLSEHMATVNYIEFLKNHTLLVSASKDATLKIWNVDFTTEINNNTSPPYERHVSPCLTTLKGHKDSVSTLSVDGSSVVSGSNDKTLRHWDLSSEKCIQTIDITTAMKSKVSDGLSLDNMTTRFDPLIGDIYCDGNALVTGTRDGIIRIWDLRIGKSIGEIEGHTGSVNSVRFKANELISGSNDKTSRLWDLRMGSLIEFLTYSESVLCSDFNSNRVFNAMRQKGLKIFDRNTRITDTLEMVNPVSTFKTDGSYLISGSVNGNIECWSC